MTALRIEQKEANNQLRIPGQPAITTGEFVVAVPDSDKTFGEYGVGNVYSVVARNLCGRCPSKKICERTQGASGGGKMRFHFILTPWDNGPHISRNEMRCQKENGFNI